jgi:hypothetical protein
MNGAMKGDASKSTMWLGCVGCGPYNNETIAYERGQPIGLGDSTGFYAFARDILILKHFGFPTVSIFLAQDRFEAFGFPTGFFDQYGYTNALDKLNATVNGENSTKPFTIWSEADWAPRSAFAIDFQLNFNNYVYLPWMVLYWGVGFIGMKINWIRSHIFGRKKQ